MQNKAATLSETFIILT